MNPVKLKNKTWYWYCGVCMLTIMLLLGILTAVATTDVDDSCISIKIILVVIPIWVWLYYRIWSLILIKIMDTLTCKCAEHGKGYAVFHYLIWATIGHPFVCFIAFLYIILAEVADSFSNETCTKNSNPFAQFVWKYFITIEAAIFGLIVLISGIMVSYKNHQDVKFQLNWKDKDQSQRDVAIQNELNDNADVYVYKGANAADNGGGVNDIEGDIGNDAKNNFNRNQVSKRDDFPLPQNTEEQLVQSAAYSANNNYNNNEDRDKVPPLPVKGTKGTSSVTMTGFWAKNQQISSAFLANMFSTQDTECVLCYEDYEVGQEIAKLKCGHRMHKKCAQEWLSQNPTCPFCRVNVLRQGFI